MEIITLSTRTKQVLTALFFASAILLTFFATKAWAMSPESAAAISIQPSIYDNYVKARPATSTTTTTTIAPKRPKPISVPVEAQPIKQASGDIWARLAACESGDPTYNGSSGYDGAFQFLPSTWRSMDTAYEFAWQAPFDVQLDAAKRLIQRSGWGQFPACARELGML